MSSRLACGLFAALISSVGCGGGGGDGSPIATTENCSFEALPATANAGGTVTKAALSAGTAEGHILAPVGSALGSYTARAGFLGSTGTVDSRLSEVSGNFNPSIGIESAPRVKVLALSAGAEIAVFVKLDLGFPFEGLTFDLESRLGPDYSGKIIIAASHSHSAWGHYTGHSAYMMGAGVLRKTIYDRFLDVMETKVREAMANLRPAKMGYVADMNFDPDNTITRDRRGENNDLMGGSRKDDAFFLIRIDGTDDEPIAMLPVYGMHGTINDEDNSLASTDAIGATERRLEERFDKPVLVMHLQGAGADVSPTPSGGYECSAKPGKDDDPCFQWLRSEGNARRAEDVIWTAYQAAGADMKPEIELEMLTQSVELGPDPRTFTIRDGALSYAPWTQDGEPDGEIWDASGNIISPIDEFNAPVGAGLCESEELSFSAALIPGTYKMPVYGSCARVAELGAIFEILLNTTFESDETHPICQSTRTTVSALRLGDLVLGTLPGEASVMLADYLRDNSPVARDRTIVMGYAQGEVGYLMMPEDWLQGGYESSINMWGPLEAEYIGEQLVKLMAMATTPEREDAAAAGADRYVMPTPGPDNFTIDDPAPMAGTVPQTVPDLVWVRSGAPASAQPDAQVRRVDGIATFVWIGDDPLVATPEVTLERETSTDVWETVKRRSGRTLIDTALLRSYTPIPTRRKDNEPQTHYWVAEWQAVPWTGADDDAGNSLDGLDGRAGAPLGNYRFRVKSKSFEITSDPFEVTHANLIVSAARAGNTITATVKVHAPKGYRLLGMTGPSNQPIAVEAGTFEVEVTLSAGSPLVFTDVAISTDGTLSVDAGSDAANATSIRITDRHDNVRSAGL